MKDLQKSNSKSRSAVMNVKDTYRMKYHLMPPVGWMNDPNGLIYFGGKYHLFYQYYPYGSAPGTMHWGHFLSEDLISYKDMGIAIAPAADGENIFSGGAVEYDGKLNALYTLHCESNKVKTETIHRAVWSNGAFEKLGCVFDNETLPANLSHTDFRDPCPVKVGDKYYVFIGGKDAVTNKGVIIVLGGSPEKLEYKFSIGPFYELGDMSECPSYCKVDGKDVIVVSGCGVAERGNNFKNVNSSVFVVGDIDFENGSMKVDFIKEIDHGDTFYAPQFVSGAAVSTIIGWFEMWDKRYPTHEWGHGWAGAFALPRTLSISGGDIFQKPVAAIESYRTPAEKIGAQSDVTVKFDGNGSLTLFGANGSVVIGNDGKVFLDTTSANNLNGCVRFTDKAYSSCVVRILLDTSGIEVFVDKGREVISSRIYLDGITDVKVSGNVSIEHIYSIGERHEK